MKTLAVVVVVLVYALVPCVLALSLWQDERRLFLLRKYRQPGTLRGGGSHKPFVSTVTRELGTRTRATATGADFSSSFRPGALSAVSLDPTLPARVNSYTVPGVFTLETGTRGANGAPQEGAA